MLRHFSHLAKKHADSCRNAKNNLTVLSIPIWFETKQKHALYEAAKLAQLGPVATIEEPIAAAKAYNLDYHNSPEVNIVVVKFEDISCEASLLTQKLPG